MYLVATTFLILLSSAVELSEEEDDARRHMDPVDGGAYLFVNDMYERSMLKNSGECSDSKLRDDITFSQGDPSMSNIWVTVKDEATGYWTIRTSDKGCRLECRNSGILYKYEPDYQLYMDQLWAFKNKKDGYWEIENMQPQKKGWKLATWNGNEGGCYPGAKSCTDKDGCGDLAVGYEGTAKPEIAFSSNCWGPMDLPEVTQPGKGTCVDFHLPYSGYTLVKKDVQCKSWEWNMGTQSSLEACAEKVRKDRDSKIHPFFIYGKGKKAGWCYIERTTSSDCPQGWEDNETDFYKLGGDQNWIGTRWRLENVFASEAMYSEVTRLKNDENGPPTLEFEVAVEYGYSKSFSQSAAKTHSVTKSLKLSAGRAFKKLDLGADTEKTVTDEFNQAVESAVQETYTVTQKVKFNVLQGDCIQIMQIKCKQDDKLTGINDMQFMSLKTWVRKCPEDNKGANPLISREEYMKQFEEKSQSLTVVQADAFTTSPEADSSHSLFVYAFAVLGFAVTGYGAFQHYKN